MKLGTLKRAFWEVFHQKGELWFPYPYTALGEPDDPSKGEEDTQEYFRDLLVALTGDDSWTDIKRDEITQKLVHMRLLDDDLELEALRG